MSATVAAPGRRKRADRFLHLCPGRIVLWGIGCVLLLSALLKWRAVREDYRLGLLGHLPESVVLGFSAFECVLGLWLASGLAASLAQKVALLLFGAFAAVQLVGLFHGDSLCGCFGAWAWDAQAVLALDLCCLGILSLASVGPSFDSFLKRLGVAACTSLLAMGICLIAAAHIHQRQSRLVNSGQVLLPHRWVGHMLPLQRQLYQIPTPQKNQQWWLVLWKSDCQDCWQQARRLFQQLSIRDRDWAKAHVWFLDVAVGRRLGENNAWLKGPRNRSLPLPGCVLLRGSRVEKWVPLEQAVRNPRVLLQAIPEGIHVRQSQRL